MLRHQLGDVYARRYRLSLLVAAVVAIVLNHAASAADPAAAVGSEAVASPSATLLTKKVQVTDVDGAPLVGAKLVPWAVRSRLGHGPWSVKGQFKSEPPSLITDNQGEVTIHFPPFVDDDQQVRPEQLSCQVEHPDFATTMYNNIEVSPATLSDRATITMLHGARIEVTATAPGQKIAPESLYVQWSSPSSGDLKRTVTAEGALVLPRLPAGTEHIQLVYLPEGGPVLFSEVKTVELEEAQQYQLQFELQPSVRVEGQLVGDVARPVKNGRVVASILQPENAEGRALHWYASATMRINGSFTFESLPRGNLQLIAICDGAMAESGEAPDFATERERQMGPNSYCRPQAFKIGEGTNHVVLKMTPTAECLIRLKGPDEQPVVGATCAFYPNVGWWGQGGSQIYCDPLYSTAEWLKDDNALRKRWGDVTLYRATTNEHGEALVRNLPARERPSRFYVEHETLQLIGDEGAFSEKAVTLKAGERKEITMRLVEKANGPAKE